MGVYFTVWLDGAGDELDRLAAGPGMKTIAEFEAALLEGYAITEGRVHVITGALKASGHPQSTYDKFSWSGEMDYSRYPGIFELARGDAATRHHPYPGRHYFFDPGGHVFEAGVRQAFWDWVTDGKGGHAPSGGLSWPSGGDLCWARVSVGNDRGRHPG
jgi:hypothetical protein